MRCKECGEKLESGARYCDFCGAPVYNKESEYVKEYINLENNVTLDSEEKPLKAPITEKRVQELFEEIRVKAEKPHYSPEGNENKGKLNVIISFMVMVIIFFAIAMSFVSGGNLLFVLIGGLNTVIWFVIIFFIIKSVRKRR